MIRARKLSKRFGDKRVLERLDLEVPRGGFVLVTGPNGSGKTTLLRLCAGLYAPTRGELEVGVPRGSIGFRWGEKGKWNLEEKDSRGNAVELRLSLAPVKDDVAPSGRPGVNPCGAMGTMKVC